MKRTAADLSFTESHGELAQGPVLVIIRYYDMQIEFESASALGPNWKTSGSTLIECLLSRELDLIPLLRYV